jgi:hypothetical protein
LGADASNQRVSRSHQRTVLGRQAPSQGIRCVQDDAHRHLPGRRKPQLPQHQPSGRVTDSKFKSIFRAC